MLDLGRAALISIMGLVLDREPSEGEALRLLLLLALSAILTWLVFRWRGTAYRFPGVREELLPGERYSGQYLQAVWRGASVHYAIAAIDYSPRAKRFEVVGRTYRSSGEKLSDFRSAHVMFPRGKDRNIEFVWEGAGDSSGYTRMTVRTAGQDYIEGDGFLTSFELHPKSFPMQFKQIHRRHIRDALGIDPPKRAEQEPDFIRTFHAVFGASIKNAFDEGGKAAA
ncbi:MAG: hypothetical protein WBX25_20140 [Rhodomicrobium sp.]